MTGSDDRDLEWKLSHLDWWREYVLPGISDPSAVTTSERPVIAGGPSMKGLSSQPEAVRETVIALMTKPELSGRPLGVLFVGLDSIQSRPASSMSSIRSANIVGRYCGEEWAAVACNSVSQMVPWANAGPRAVTDILVAVVNVWCRHFDALAIGGADAAADGLTEAVDSAAEAEAAIAERAAASARAEVLQRAARDGYRAGAKTLGEAMALSAEGVVDSASLRELARLGLEEFVPVDRQVAWTRLLDFEGRDLEILAGRIYPVGEKKTLERLAQDLDVTRERIRQIEKSIAERLRDRLASDPECAPVAHMAARLSRQCRALCTDAVMVAAIDEFCGADDSDRELRVVVLRGLAGPYEFKDGFWQRADEYAGIRQRLLERADLPVDAGELEALMDEFDVHPEARDDLVSSMPLKEFGGHLVVWSGSMSDKATVILGLRGDAMTRDELREALGGEEVNVRSMSNAIQSDERIRRLGRDKYGLSAWGGEEYTTIVDEITQAIERRGGRADLNEVVQELVEWFDVSAASVRTYAANSGVFGRDDDGMLIVAPAGAEVERAPRVPPETCRDLYVHDGDWVARIPIDGEVLRGSGRPCRVAVAHALGVWPGDSKAIITPQGETSVTWKRFQPTYGSTRAIAVAMSCQEGDLMFVPLTANKDCRRIAAADLADASGLARVALECGLDRDATMGDVAVAIGLPADTAAADVAVRLRSRQQDDVARLLPTGPDTDDDVLSELMGLGE